MSQSFKQFLEVINRNPAVYQITYLRNIQGIIEQGLLSRGGFSAWDKPHLQQHSQKGVFFCSTSQCAKYWIDTLLEQAFHLSDHIIEEEFIPVVLRFKLNRNAWQKDLLGNAEMSDKTNFYTQKSINPLGIEVWDGKKWSKDLYDAYSLKYQYGDDEDIEAGDYPYPTSW